MEHKGTDRRVMEVRNLMPW